MLTEYCLQSPNLHQTKLLTNSSQDILLRQQVLKQVLLLHKRLSQLVLEQPLCHCTLRNMERCQLKKSKTSGVNVWLVNTGYNGKMKRCSLKDTRAPYQQLLLREHLTRQSLKNFLSSDSKYLNLVLLCLTKVSLTQKILGMTRLNLLPNLRNQLKHSLKTSRSLKQVLTQKFFRELLSYNLEIVFLNHT